MCSLTKLYMYTYFLINFCILLYWHCLDFEWTIKNWQNILHQFIQHVRLTKRTQDLINESVSITARTHLVVSNVFTCNLFLNSATLFLISHTLVGRSPFSINTRFSNACSLKNTQRIKIKSIIFPYARVTCI
jgi:hypothetical protein